MGDLVAALSLDGVGQGDLVGLMVTADGASAATMSGTEWAGPVADVAVADAAVRPRWTMWSQETARTLVGQGIRLATSWDIAAVHRLLFGGWRADPGYAWACLHGQPPDQVPVAAGAPDLFSVADDAPDAPVLGAAAAL